MGDFFFFPFFIFLFPLWGAGGAFLPIFSSPFFLFLRDSGIRREKRRWNPSPFPSSPLRAIEEKKRPFFFDFFSPVGDVEELLPYWYFSPFCLPIPSSLRSGRRWRWKEENCPGFSFLVFSSRGIFASPALWSFFPPLSLFLGKNFQAWLGFSLYGTAAVFSPLFFPHSSPPPQHGKGGE